MKKRPTEWEEMLEVYVSDKGLISKIRIAKKKKKPPFSSIIKRQITQFKNGKRYKQTFLQGRYKKGQ